MAEFAREPEFLQIYRSGDKEWPGYKVPIADNSKSSIPMLISEIFRLIPYIGTQYVQFHPKNMPDVKIDKIEIVGIVTDRTDMLKYTSYTVDDSTGEISVLYPNSAFSKHESNDDEHSVDAENQPELITPFQLPPSAPYSYERHLQNLWNLARDEDALRNEVGLYDYVHVMGFCAMSFRHQKDVNKLKDQDIELGRLFIFGINLRRISEANHNAMMKDLITHVTKERYLKPKP